MIFGLALMVLISPFVSGQKTIKLDAELKAGCNPLEAKRKGISSIGKYQFGIYKIVSGKAGWITTKSRSHLFSFETQSESKSKSSFVFVVNDNDTILVNTSTNTISSETNAGAFSMLNESNDNFTALIAPESDTVVWNLILVFRSGSDVEGNFKADGILTDGQVNLTIRQVKQWEDGRSPAFNPVLGYAFYLENTAVAAVQTSIDMAQKKFVWLKQDLNENFKSVLAASSAALMIYSDAMAAEMSK